MALGVVPKGIEKGPRDRNRLERTCGSLHTDDFLLALGYHLLGVRAGRPPILKRHRDSILRQVRKPHPDYNFIKNAQLGKIVTRAPSRDKA
jgi:hypothetical protein